MSKGGWYSCIFIRHSAFSRRRLWKAGPKSRPHPRPDIQDKTLLPQTHRYTSLGGDANSTERIIYLNSSEEVTPSVKVETRSLCLYHSRYLSERSRAWVIPITDQRQQPWGLEMGVISAPCLRRIWGSVGRHVSGIEKSNQIKCLKEYNHGGDTISEAAHFVGASVDLSLQVLPGSAVVFRGDLADMILFKTISMILSKCLFWWSKSVKL